VEENSRNLIWGVLAFACRIREKSPRFERRSSRIEAGVISIWLRCSIIIIIVIIIIIIIIIITIIISAVKFARK
jgi:hypothetical protein